MTEPQAAQHGAFPLNHHASDRVLIFAAGERVENALALLRTLQLATRDRETASACHAIIGGMDEAAATLHCLQQRSIAGGEQ